MSKTLLFLILCFALVASLVSAEKEIHECTQREAELSVAKEECTKATSFELSARRDRDGKEAEYKRALTSYDYAYAEWQVASREEAQAKNKYHADLEVLTTIRRVENELCDKLVRNVDNGTPCAKLLERARRQNRLQQCRAAKQNLIQISEKEAASKKVYERLQKVTIEKHIKKNALRKVRDDAFDVFKVATALWTTRHATKQGVCARYNSLRITFHGSQGRSRVNEVCKQVEECVALKYECAQYQNGRCVRNKVVCGKRATKKVCARRYYRPRISGPSSCRSGEVIAFRKEGRSLTRFCKRQETDNRRVLVCQSTYDPFVFTFKNRGFDMKSEGDYELYASFDGSVEVHNRQSLLSNSLVTVNTKIAVLANGADLITLDCRQKALTLNGKSIRYANANTQLPNGGSVKISGYTFEVFAPNGDKVYARVNGQNDYCWINTYIFSKNSNGGGLCYAEASEADKFRVTGLFKHFEVPHESRSAITAAQQDALSETSASARRSANAACKIANLPERFQRQCVEDWLLAVPSFRPTVIAGYEQMLRDEIRGGVNNSNFF